VTNSETAKAVDLFPALKDKFAVRLVSRLNAVKEQARVQQEKEGFINEMWSFFTGDSQRRQNYINGHLTSVVEQTVEQLTEVMDSLSFTERALDLVVSELKNLQGHSEVITYEVVGLKERLSELEASVNHRFCALAGSLKEVDFRLRASHQLDRAIWRWKAGSLSSLPTLLRCYSVLEELWWGDFGYYINQYPGVEATQLLESLRFRLISCLSEDVNAKPGDRLPREIWFLPLKVGENPQLSVINQTVNLLSDWATYDDAPYVSLMRTPDSGDHSTLLVPHAISADRLGRELLNEVFICREAA